MIQELIGIIILIVGYILGYTAGYINGKGISAGVIAQDIQTTISRGIKKIMPDNRIRPGIIKRPTAQELLARKEPIEVKQAKEAVKESLDQIPELQEHKRALEEYRKAQRGIL